jgi:hypothetical protein
MVVKFLREFVLDLFRVDSMWSEGKCGYVRDIMVHSREGTIWATNLSTGGPSITEF